MSTDAVSSGHRTLLDLMSEVLPEERRQQVREAVEKLNLDPDNPRVVIHALGSDLMEIAERIPDAIAEATAQIEERAQSASDTIVSAFETGIARAKPAAAAFISEEMTTFQVALDKIIAERLKFLIGKLAKHLESPWYKYGTILVCAVAGLAFFAAGMVSGRIQGAESVRSYDRLMVVSAPSSVRRYIETYQARNGAP